MADDLREGNGNRHDRVHSHLRVHGQLKDGLQQWAVRSQQTPLQARLVVDDDETPPVIGMYVIEDKLGEGGMGHVYRAVHKKMKREVALKVISPQVLKDKTTEQRFNREVEAAARLSHPICRPFAIPSLMVRQA